MTKLVEVTVKKVSPKSDSLHASVVSLLHGVILRGVSTRAASCGIKVLVSLGPVIGLVQPSPLAVVRVERPVRQSTLIFEWIDSLCVE